jgi:hypothetical protein
MFEGFTQSAEGVRSIVVDGLLRKFDCDVGECPFSIALLWSGRDRSAGILRTSVTSTVLLAARVGPSRPPNGSAEGKMAWPCPYVTREE